MKLIHHNEEQPIIIGNIIDKIDIEREFKSTSHELRMIEDKFYKIFDLNPCPMSLASLEDETIIDVNDAFLKEVGMKHKSEVIGKKNY